MSFGGATRTRRASWPPIVAVEPRDVRPDIYFEDLLKAATPPRKQADGSGKKASNGADDPESFMRKEGKAGKPV